MKSRLLARTSVLKPVSTESRRYKQTSERKKNIPDSFSHQLGANSLLPVSSIDFAKISIRALLQDRERQRGDARVIIYSVTMLPCSGWILQWWSTEQYHDMNMRQQHWWHPLPLQDSRVHRTTPICCLHCKTRSILDTPKRTGCLQQKNASMGFKDCLVKYNICMYKYETQN